jgi:hypothetical protein
MNLENPFTVFKAKEPFPAALAEKQAAQSARAVIRVETGGNNEAEAAAVTKQSMGLLQKAL